MVVVIVALVRGFTCGTPLVDGEGYLWGTDESLPFRSLSSSSLFLSPSDFIFPCSHKQNIELEETFGFAPSTLVYKGSEGPLGKAKI